MKIHSFVRRGEQHKDFCEDFVITNHLIKRYLICAVFDGCSSGKESYFASALFGKIFRQVCREFSAEECEELSPAKILRSLIWQSISKVIGIKNMLNLDVAEILTTINIMVLDKDNRSGTIMCIGDGFVAINGKFHEIDQDNRPDYIAYYLSDLDKPEKFDDWFKSIENKFDVQNIEDVSIATDGIFTFTENNTDPDHAKINFNIQDYLIRDKYLITNTSMLSRKCNILKNKYGLLHNDDLSIVRVRFNE